MVNYKRVVCEVAALGLILSVVNAAPAPDCTEKHFDQRQNGTENYRLNIDGVVIALAPAQSLLAAASSFDIASLLEMEDFDEFTKPKPPANLPVKPEDSKPTELNTLTDASKPSESSSDSTVKALKKDASVRKHEKAQRLKLHLANYLLPLLRKNRHH